MKIEDNFLNEEEFIQLQQFITSNHFCWHYNDTIVNWPPLREHEHQFQFIYMFFQHDLGPNRNFHIMEPILKKLKIDNSNIIRVKANLTTRTEKHDESEFHTDVETNKIATTSIFYINTTNGYTEFKDGTKVEGIANRMVTFPSDTYHRGVTSTDNKIRVVVNFNYIGASSSVG